MRKKKSTNRIIMVALLLVALLLPTVPMTLYAVQNPTPEEINKIFDEVAYSYKVPAEILKGIAYTETGWRQWNSLGNPVVNKAGSPDYLGIMQIGTYNPTDTDTAQKLKNDIRFNIAYGAKTLISKWEATPRIGDGDPGKIENWYFALWAYNSWSTRNNPNNAAAAGRVAYQDKILALIGKDYYHGLTTPVKITPIPKSLLPAGTLPTKKVPWTTPEPFHYATYTKVEKPLTAEEKALVDTVPRISGVSPIETGIQAALQGWPDGSATVVLTKAGDFPDALAGVALAKKFQAPVLLTATDRLDPALQKALQQLNPVKVILLGGEGAISRETEQEIRAALPQLQALERIAGEHRFETAAKIAEAFPNSPGVAIATGYDFPDALSLTAAAAAQGFPLLLVEKDRLPAGTAEVLAKLKPQTIYVAGGEGAVSDAVLAQIQQLTQTAPEQIRRFSGTNRYDTSAKILQTLYPTTGNLILVSGETFPDALAAASLATGTDTPLLLMDPAGEMEASSAGAYLKLQPRDLKFKVVGSLKALPQQKILQILRFMAN